MHLLETGEGRAETSGLFAAGNTGKCVSGVAAQNTPVTPFSQL